MNPILQYLHGLDVVGADIQELLIVESARVIIKQFTLGRLDEVLALNSNNREVPEFLGIQNFIDLCKRTQLIESVTHAGQLENLCNAVFDNVESRFFVRSALLELRIGLGTTGFDLLVKEIADGVYVSTVPDSPLIAKNRIFPKMDREQIINLFDNERWLVVCLLLKYTSLIDKDVDK